METKDISKLVKQQLEKYENKLDLKEGGYVFQVADGTATVYGLGRVMYGEMVTLPHDVTGMVLNLEKDSSIIPSFDSEIEIGIL